jgi:hypothetical protein
MPEVRKSSSCVRAIGWSSWIKQGLLILCHSRDLQIGEDGTVNEIEEEVALNDLPKAVRDALILEASGAQVVKVESLTKRGKLVAYEASTLKGKHKGEVQVGHAGDSLAHEE